MFACEQEGLGTRLAVHTYCQVCWCMTGTGTVVDTLLTNFHIIVNLASSMTYAIHWAREGLVLCTRIQGNTEILYIHTTLM